MRTRLKYLPAIACALLVPSLVAPARAADPPAETIRMLVSKYKPATVTLSVVIRTAMQQGPRDTEVEIPGFVLDASGLIVTTNTAIDPASTLSGNSDDSERMTTKVASIRILPSVGLPIPAKVVLRDTDRNLAFIRPATPSATPFVAIDFKAAGKAQIGDPVFIMGRMGPVANRATDVKMDRIVSVIEKPRTLYVASALSASSLGNVVFNEQGEPLGIVTLRVSQSQRRTFNGNDNYLPVIVTAEDVLEVGAQAPQAKDVKDTPELPKPTTPPAKTAPGVKKPAGK